MALVMFDIDHFKAVNDTFGHGIGDELLTALTGIVAGRLRGSDSMARWGGDEFLILLPETDQRGALELAESIRATVADTDLPGPGGGTTISLGVAAYRKGEALKDLTKRLDDALYDAKLAGRNRVVVAADTV
jgi:diguanylate cyclase (GGDEF)-like protein